MKIVAFLLIGLLLADPAHAASFRGIQPIAGSGPAPAGMIALPAPQPLDRALIEGTVRRFVTAWNTPALETFIDPAFWDRTRLLDTLLRDAPRDARLRLMAIGPSQTLMQWVKREDSGDYLLVSEVSVVVDTQIEYNHPSEGLKRIAGGNELIFEITLRVPR